MCEYPPLPPPKPDQRIEIVIKPGDPDWVRALAKLVRAGRLRFDLGV